MVRIVSSKILMAVELVIFVGGLCSILSFIMGYIGVEGSYVGSYNGDVSELFCPAVDNL